MTILTDDRFVRHVQSLLVSRGHLPSGSVDGVPGPRTFAALDQLLPLGQAGGTPFPAQVVSDDDFVRAVQHRLTELGHFHGLIGGHAGPLTMGALQTALGRAVPTMPVAVASQRPVPWIEAALEALGWEEVRDNAKLAAWLKREGSSIGNPASVPWCGDFVQTALQIGLPDEEFPGPLGVNPFWALNWKWLGMRLEEPGFGCVAYKSRNGGGHVTFPVGRSRDGRTLFCLGGNQNNRVCIAAYAATDFLGFRWPKTWAGAPQDLPLMDAARLPRAASEF